MMKHHGPTLLLLGACLLGLAGTSSRAQEPAPGEPQPGKLALVLSGGGARGAAHIGVLRVLEEHHVAPDLIVGTSMGAVVGGLYSAGYSPDEIEAILRDVDWEEVFFDTVDRDERSFRRKQDDTPYFIPAKLRFRDHKPFLPAGLLAGQRLEFMLRRLVLEATSADDFDDLPVPFRAVAMDLATSDPVVLGSGNLADAIRASMSIPGAFAPVWIDGHALVDGGSAANLPIRIANSLGAESVIAVNVSSPLNSSVEDSSFLEVLNQLTAFLTSGSVQADLQLLREGDVLIEPALGDITFSNFDRATETVAIGVQAANSESARLARFTATPERWEQFRAAHKREDATALPVAAVEIDYTGPVDRRIVERRIDVPLGEPFDADSLEGQLTALRGLNYFGMMRYDLATDPDASRLAIRIDEPRHGPTNMQVGGSLRTDFGGDSSFAILARHQWLAVNRRAAEWTNTVQFGERALYFSEFHQPLDFGLRYYVRPRVTIARINQSLWFEGDRVAEYRVMSEEASARIGRFLGRWGDLYATAFRGLEEGDPRIGVTIFPSFDDDTGGVRLGFDIDTRNLAVFPTSGTDLRAWVERDLEAFGASEDGTLAEVNWKQFFTAGRTTISPRISATANISGQPNFASLALAGGFQRLSGLGDNELIGSDGGVAGVDVYYEWLSFGQGPFLGRVFAGLTLEAGNTYLEDDPVTWSSLREGAALWVGAATPLGPIHFGWGWTDPDRNRAYLIIGDRF